MRTAKIILIFTVLILSYSANCQFFENSIIKTRPFQDFVGFNPNIGIEKPVSEKISPEFELMYRNRTWYSNGGEWNFGKFHLSNRISFEVYIGPSLYLFCDKRTEIIDSLDPNEIGTIEHDTYPFGEYGRLAFSWTIGYLLK